MTDDRLRGVELELASLSRLIAENLRELHQSVAKHDSHLFGALGKPGLLTRTDRLEQSESIRRWGVRAAVVSALTALAAHLL